MNKLSASTTINAPITAVWAMIADVGTIADWHPGVARSPVLSTRPTGLGAKRRV